jgi:glycosyltransferase involved in cell wall biosynthesis
MAISKHPIFSIIIPHYNSTTILSRAVNSIPNNSEIEILIIDNSKEKLNYTLFAPQRTNIKILYSEYGKGAGRARNIGLKEAKGKWILFCDADDYFSDIAFPMFYKYKKSQNDIIFFNVTSKNKSKIESNRLRHQKYSQYISDYFEDGKEANLRYHYSVPWGKMYSRIFIMKNKILFDEVPASNDVMFSLKTGYLANKIQVDATTVYCVTTQKKSLTTTFSLKNIESRYKVAITYNNFIYEHGIQEKYSPTAPYLIQIFKQNKLKFVYNSVYLLFHSKKTIKSLCEEFKFILKKITH